MGAPFVALSIASRWRHCRPSVAQAVRKLVGRARPIRAGLASRKFTAIAHAARMFFK